MIAQRPAVGLGSGFLAANEITNLIACLALAVTLAATHADDTQTFPGVRVTNPCRVPQNVGTPFLLSAMSSLFGLPRVIFAILEFGVKRLEETGLNILQQ